MFRELAHTSYVASTTFEGVSRFDNFIYYLSIFSNVLEISKSSLKSICIRRRFYLPYSRSIVSEENSDLIADIFFYRKLELDMK